MLYKNTDTVTRVWPGLTVDGRTLELAPGERADLGTRVVTDPYLKPAPRTRSPKAATNEETR